MTHPAPLRRRRPRPFRTLPSLLLAASLAGCAATPDAGEQTGRAYSFWPPFPAEPHVQFLVSYELSSDIEPPKSALEQLVYGEDREVLPVNKPYGLAMRDGRIYVCDIRNAGVVVLDLRKRQTRVMRAGGFGGMSQPTDIAIADDGMMYVADRRRAAVFVFDSAERHVASFGHQGFQPVAIALHDDELYISDFTSQSVLVLDRHTGEQLRSIGQPGGEDGHFIRPLGLDVDDEGNLYVADVIKCRLQKFSPRGKLLFATGQTGRTPGNFVRPKNLVVDAEGLIYVVDAAFNNVQMFNAEGQVLMYFGSAGPHPGNMNLPAGICVSDSDLDLFQQYVHPLFDARRLIVVTNQFGPQKVSVYALGELRPGVSVMELARNVASVASGLSDPEEEPDEMALPEGTEEPMPQPPLPFHQEPEDTGEEDPG